MLPCFHGIYAVRPMHNGRTLPQELTLDQPGPCASPVRLLGLYHGDWTFRHLSTPAHIFNALERIIAMQATPVGKCKSLCARVGSSAQSKELGQLGVWPSYHPALTSPRHHVSMRACCDEVHSCKAHLFSASAAPSPLYRETRGNIKIF
eukprot:1157749-Pelagomonas_calceolata.AAC.2